MKQTVKRILLLTFKLLPNTFWRILFRLWVQNLVNQNPKNALRVLLTVDDDLTSQINQVAVTYDNGIHVKHRLTKYHDFFVERLHSAERVLDIGCGNGALAYSMATRAEAKVTGIDLEPENISKAQTLFQHPNLNFLVGDVLQDLPAGTFDTVVMSNVLEHIEERVELLKKVERDIQPKRWLIRIPMINRDWRVPLRQELGLFYYSDPTHYTEYTQESFEQEMISAGLVITHLQINWGEIWAEVQSKDE